MARRHGRATRPVGGLALAVVLLVAACSAPAGEPDGGTSPTSPAPVETTAPPAPVATEAAQPPGPDVRGVIAPLPARPEAGWLLAAADLDVADLAGASFHDPRYPPTIDGWPMVGIIAVGEVWVVGVADAASDRQWLVALDPETGERVATTGVTRGDGPPSSCTGGLADGTLACLYGDTVELVDPAAGTAVARLTLEEPAHSIHAVDGEILLLGFATDGTVVRLTRMTAAGEEEWAVSVSLTEDEALAVAGSYLPVVQTVPGLVLVGVGGLQLAIDATGGDVAWQGMADVLAVGPDGGLVASSRGEPAWGIASRLERLDETATVTRGTEELSWSPAAANSGRVPGPIVADDGDAVVGVTPDGEQAWRIAADPEQLRVPMVRADGVVVLQDTAGVMTAVEPETGTVRWRNNAGSKGWGARGWGALTDGERMVVRSADGIIAVDLTDGSLEWQVRVPAGDGQVWELVDLGHGLVAAGERTIRAYFAGTP